MLGVPGTPSAGMLQSSNTHQHDRKSVCGIHDTGRDSLNWPQDGGLKWPHLYGNGVSM